MTETRHEYLARVAEQHHQWVGEQLQDAPFDPASNTDRADYNVWHVDMDADPAAQAEFLARAGDPDAEEVDDADGA